MKPRNIALHGPRVTIRPLRRPDLDTMSSWPRFDDPLDRLFDWPRRSPRENDAWFTHLMRDRARVYYAIENESHELIGRISLREIRGRRSARLGIGLGPQFVGRGYGSEALRVFLGYYFAELGFARMVLDVAAVNERAIRCYERCGFRYIGVHYQEIAPGHNLAFLDEERYRSLRRYFVRHGSRAQMLHYDMVLNKEDWQGEGITTRLPRAVRTVASLLSTRRQSL